MLSNTQTQLRMLIGEQQNASFSYPLLLYQKQLGIGQIQIKITLCSLIIFVFSLLIRQVCNAQKQKCPPLADNYLSAEREGFEPISEMQYG